jgi:hypothetical protein
MKTYRWNTDEQLCETAWGSMKNPCHFMAGFVLGNGKDLKEGFLFLVSEPDTATIHENWNKEGIKEFPPREE